MPQIDPKFMFWFGVWTNILMLIAGYSVDHAPAIVAQYAPAVQWLCGVSYKINGVILTAMAALSSNKSGVFITEPSAAPPTIPPAVVRILIGALLLSAFLFAPPANAQSPRPRPAQPVDLVQKMKDDFSAKTGVQATGDLPYDLLRALDAKMLPDLQYALKLAQATGSNVTAPCYQAWIDMINTRLTAVQAKGADGAMADMPVPDPHLVTDFERMVELRNALQPDSKFMTSCSPVANLIKQDVVSFMGKVIAGGAGLATLVPGL